MRDRSLTSRCARSTVASVADSAPAPSRHTAACGPSQGIITASSWRNGHRPMAPTRACSDDVPKPDPGPSESGLGTTTATLTATAPTSAAPTRVPKQAAAPLDNMLPGDTVPARQDPLVVWRFGGRKDEAPLPRKRAHEHDHAALQSFIASRRARQRVRLSHALFTTIVQ